MGLRGPRRLPSRLQDLKGDPGNRRKIKEAKPVTTDQPPPDYLQGKSLNKWNELSAVLSPAGLLTNADRDALGMYCLHFEFYLQALAAVRKEGQVMEFHSNKQGRSLSMTHPQATNLAKLHDAMLRTAQHFGMTPSRRLDVPQLAVHDPLAEFVGM